MFSTNLGSLDGGGDDGDGDDGGGDDEDDVDNSKNTSTTIIYTDHPELRRI